MSESHKPRGLDAARLQHLKATIEGDIESGRYHGAGIIVARDGQIGLHEALGRVRSTSQNPVRKDSVFSLLSVTKAITNVLVLRAIERGQLNLFTKVSALIPEFSGLPRSEITVENLLTHRSGLPGVYTPRAGMNLDRLDEIVAAICASLHGVDAPGTRVNYSPMACHALIGELLRRTDPHKRSYRKIVQDDLFTPLGMKDSSIGVRADLKSRHIPPEIAAGISRDPSRLEQSRHAWRLRGGKFRDAVGRRLRHGRRHVSLRRDAAARRRARRRAHPLAAHDRHRHAQLHRRSAQRAVRGARPDPRLESRRPPISAWASSFAERN